jgi:hypothetical protein
VLKFLKTQRGVKKDSEGKNVFWFGYKEHLAVGNIKPVYSTVSFFVWK